MTITFEAGNSDNVEGARGIRHTIATRLVTHVHNVSPTPFVTCFTYVLLRHRARYIHDHVIVLINIIVEKIKTFRGVVLPVKHYVFTRQALIDGYFIVPKMFLEFD